MGAANVRNERALNMDIDQLERHLSHDDGVAVLLRGHLWIEGALTELIRATFEFPDEWSDLDRLAFPSKVALARAQGALFWDEPLLELNRVRNRLAHNVTYDVNDATAASLLKSFPELSAIPEGIGPLRPGALTPERRVVEVVRDVVVSLLTYLWDATVAELQVRTAQMQDQTFRLQAAISDGIRRD